jgi:asparagine synthase (glutamine-hydrolysing)
MCGIAGLMTHDGTAPLTGPLQAMGAALGHRGPDGDGRYRSGDVGMVQTRLAIIDLATGDQPLYEPGGAALIANGEIYNYIELRRELGCERPAAFSTQSDCEPPLHLYRRHGLDFTAYLRGMYAIALHDPGAGRLVLARDPFGIKPLYYAETPHAFAFASEPGALIDAGIVTPQLVRPARNELVQMQFTTGRETIFAGINRVLPGETVVVRQGRIVERRRREALPEGGPVTVGEEEGLARLDAAFAHSVCLHQRSDVPFGMFLSGGIDSTAVLVMMARLAARPVKAFTIGFAESNIADERGRPSRRGRACRGRVRRGGFLELTARDRIGRRRSGCRLRDLAYLGARPGRAPGRAQGDPVGRGGGRTVWRLWALSQRDAPMVGGRPHAPGARRARRARHIARRDCRLA